MTVTRGGEEDRKDSWEVSGGCEDDCKWRV